MDPIIDPPLHFHGKYRIPSARLQGWNYANPGYYFVTICTKNRTHWFGEIRNGWMCISDVGAVVDACWREISMHYPRVVVDRFVVMPNHIHGILIIQELDSNIVETPYYGVSTEPRNPHHRREWQSGSLGSIIQQFKSASTKRIRALGHPDFAWQPRFHDHITHDADDIARIREYISNNPATWETDDLYL
jgi:REP element-mobilizing transposase RayT